MAYRVSPAKSLTHPLFLAALLILLANDHTLKGSGLLPGWITGKLSDFAGLVVAPTVLAWCLRVRTRWAWRMAHAIVGLVFASFELTPSLCEEVARLSAPIFPLRMVADLGDLLALPALFASYLILGRARRVDTASDSPLASRPNDAATKALGVAALLACCASSRNPPVRVASDANHLYAQHFGYGAVAILDGRSGAMRRIVKPYAPIEPPVVFGDTMYLCGDQTRPGLVAVRIESGETIYRTLDRRPPTSLVAVDERYVYGTRLDGGTFWIMVMDRERGTFVGEFAAGSGMERVLVRPVAPGKIAVLVEGEITIHAPVATEGKFAPIDGDDFLDFAADGMHLIAATEDGALVGFELSKPTLPSFVRVDARAIRGRSMSIVRGVLAYNTSDGAALVHADSGRAIATMPEAWLFSIDSTGFYAFADGALIASELDGRVRWSIPASFAWPASLALTDDSVAIRDGDALLLGYDKRNGAPTFRFAFEAIPPTE